MGNFVAEAAAARRLHALADRLRLSILLAVILAFISAPLLAADPASRGASTARTTRDEAIRTLPLSKLSPDARNKVAAVISDVSLFRRLPIETVDCEPDLFQFVVANPDLMVNIWHVMGVTNVTLDRLDADHYRCSDGDGTTARLEIVYRSQDTAIIYAEGMYEGPLFPKAVRGQCVAVLKYGNSRQANGRFYETARLDTFLHVDNVGVELLAKVFQSVVGRTIDHNFSETMGFLGSMSRTSEINPRGMRRLAAKLDRVDPEVREEFVVLTSRVSTKLAGVDAPGEAENPALAEVIQSSAVSVPQTNAGRR